MIEPEHIFFFQYLITVKPLLDEENYKRMENLAV